MFSRRGQSSCAARAGLLLASRSTSCSDPRAQYSVTTHGGVGQTPRKDTMLGWRSAAIMPASCKAAAGTQRCIGALVLQRTG